MHTCEQKDTLLHSYSHLFTRHTVQYMNRYAPIHTCKDTHSHRKETLQRYNCACFNWMYCMCSCRGICNLQQKGGFEFEGDWTSHLVGYTALRCDLFSGVSLDDSKHIFLCQEVHSPYCIVCLLVAQQLCYRLTKFKLDLPPLSKIPLLEISVCRFLSLTRSHTYRTHSTAPHNKTF